MAAKVKLRQTTEAIIGMITGTVRNPERLVLGRYSAGGEFAVVDSTGLLTDDQRRSLGAGDTWSGSSASVWTSPSTTSQRWRADSSDTRRALRHARRVLPRPAKRRSRWRATSSFRMSEGESAQLSSDPSGLLARRTPARLRSGVHHPGGKPGPSALTRTLPPVTSCQSACSVSAGTS